MQGDWPLTLGAALALLAVGALLGELWARLRAPSHSPSSRRGRPHFLLGLNYLVSSEPELAIRELSQAVRQETEAVEAYLALGNLLRENGQTERAIDIHKSLLHRQRLSEWERTQVLLSLAMDFKRAGLIDRAERTFREVAEREPGHLSCLRGLQDIAVETGRYGEALQLEREIQGAGGGAPELAAALESEWGTALLDDGSDESHAHYRAALDLRPDYAPARIGLAECLLREGDVQQAVEHLEQAVRGGQPWATAALEPLRRACSRLDDLAPLERSCETVLEADPRSWRAWLELARIRADRDDMTAARTAIERAVTERPGSLAVQRQLWELIRRRGEGIEEFMATIDDAIDDSRLIDPFVCFRCGFRSAELWARCRHCHGWGTMSEERRE